MKPLQAIAMGLLVVILQAPIGDVDLLANPVGWLLVLLGLSHLTHTVPHHSVITGLAVTSLLVSIPLVVPAVIDLLDDADDSIAWTVNLPWLGFLVMLSNSLVAAAFEDDDRPAAAWWRLAQLGALAVVALPVLVFGGGITSLEDTAGIAVAVVPLYVIVLLFSHSGRPWAAERSTTDEFDQAEGNPGEQIDPT